MVSAWNLQQVGVSSFLVLVVVAVRTYCDSLCLCFRYAITLGSIGDYEGTQAKIENGYKFKVGVHCCYLSSLAQPSPYF